MYFKLEYHKKLGTFFSGRECGSGGEEESFSRFSNKKLLLLKQQIYQRKIKAGKKTITLTISAYL